MQDLGVAAPGEASSLRPEEARGLATSALSLALFTRVRGREILRTSLFRPSQKKFGIALVRYL
jgi:hypothetical protein